MTILWGSCLNGSYKGGIFGIVKCEQRNEESVFKETTPISEKNKLKTEFFCGHGYRGAVNMYLQSVRVQKSININVKKRFTPIIVVKI